GGSAQRRDDLALDQFGLLGRGGGVGEVEDPVTHALIAHRAELLDNLLGGAVRGHVAVAGDLPLDLVLVEVPPEAVRVRALTLAQFGLVRTDHHVVVRAAHDGVEVGADVAAVLTEHLALVGEPFWRAVEVRVLPVPGGDAEGDLLTTTGDPQRQPSRLDGPGLADGAVDLVVLAVERRAAVGPGLLEDLHALLEHFQPDPGTGEPVPVSTPLVLVPTA